MENKIYIYYNHNHKPENSFKITEKEEENTTETVKKLQ